MANRTVMAKQLKCIVFTTLVIIVFMIAMPIFIMKPKVSANQVEEITNSNESVEASTKQNNNIIIKGNETVKVYITETGKIEEVNLEDYICGVVSNEMPANFEKEALKAQAVAARPTLSSMVHLPSLYKTVYLLSYLQAFAPLVFPKAYVH